jgi:hypothetical protein
MQTVWRAELTAIFRCDTRETDTTGQPLPPCELYSALMKPLRVLLTFVALFLLASFALGQSKPTLPDSPRPQNTSSQMPDSSGNQLISQAGRYPRPLRGPARYPHGPYASHYAPMHGLSPLGALIGFGAGAALGATSPGNHVAGGRVAAGLVGGGLGALLGGVIGGCISVAHSQRFRDWERAHEKKRYTDGPRPDESNLEASTPKDLSDATGGRTRGK